MFPPSKKKKNLKTLLFRASASAARQSKFIFVREPQNCPFGNARYRQKSITVYSVSPALVENLAETPRGGRSNVKVPSKYGLLDSNVSIPFGKNARFVSENNAVVVHFTVVVHRRATSVEF